MVSRSDYKGTERPTWCPGCGNFGILNALQRALVEQGFAPHEVLVVTGIGCGSKLPHYTTVNGFHSLHGRPVPLAQGARLAHHKFKIVTVHGDGDGYGEGLGHAVHAFRRNIGIVDMVQNNKIYGLTKGQYSPTSDPGKKTATSPEGALDKPVQPLALAITNGTTFVARGYAGELKHLIWLMGEALQHDGYALLDILQPCVTFNKERAYDYYKERVYKLEDEEDYDPTDRTAAWERAQEWGDRIPLGIFYRKTGEPTYESQLPTLEEGPPLVERPVTKLSDGQVAALNGEIS
jgi:2-oxoglutarate ferredoxin oxidoreductase subunit beta